MTILSIDPGINHIGICVAYPEEDCLRVESIVTYNIRKLLPIETEVGPPMLEMQLEFISTLIRDLAIEHDPQYVVGELQVQGVNVLAYGKQREGLSALRSGLWRWIDTRASTWEPYLHLVHPGETNAAGYCRSGWRIP